MVVTISQVESLDAKGWQALTDEKKENLLDIAGREADQMYNGQVASLPEIEGSRDDFVKHLAAHKWELAEGGEAQSESATGGSVSYNTVTGESLNNLTQTRFGREALSYLRDDASIGIVRTW